MELHGFGIATYTTIAAIAVTSIVAGVMTLFTPSLGKWRSAHC